MDFSSAYAYIKHDFITTSSIQNHPIVINFFVFNLRKIET